MGFAETRDNHRTLHGAMLLACEADQLQEIYGMNLALHGEAERDMPAKPNAVCECRNIATTCCAFSSGDRRSNARRHSP
jgi:hypothetical protein